MGAVQKTNQNRSSPQCCLYGAVCIGMAGLASLMGGLLQAALSIFGMVGGPLLGLFSLGILFPFANSLGAVIGLVAGSAISLWVGIGSQIYPPLPLRSLPKYLSVEGCNFSTTDTYWNFTTALPTVADLMTEAQVGERPALADNWYSLSYLYFSTIGTIITIIAGIIASLLSGGLKQNVNRDFLLTSQDFDYLEGLLPSSWGKEKEKVEVLKWKAHDSDPCPEKGTDNPAFSHMEMYSTERNEKVNGLNS